MCTPSALETALRSCIRKGTGNCTAIAVTGFAYQEPCGGDCVSEPINTRVVSCIVSGKLQVNISSLTEEGPLVTCDNLVPFAELVQKLICAVGNGTNTVGAITDAGWDASCVDATCGDRSLLELFAASVTESADTAARVRVVENNDVFAPLDCITALLPLETLLRMAIVELPGGAIAWRMQNE